MITGEDYEKVFITSVDDIFIIFYDSIFSRRIHKRKNIKIRRLDFSPEEEVEELKEILLYDVIIRKGIKKEIKFL